MPWHKELFEYAESLGKVKFCTTPILNPFSASGKLAWVEKWYPKMIRRTNVMVDKHDLANSRSLLIDDWKKNIEKFSQEGGKVLHFPYDIKEPRIRKMVAEYYGPEYFPSAT